MTGMIEGFIFVGLKVSIPVFFWVGKFGKYSFDQNRAFWGI